MPRRRNRGRVAPPVPLPTAAGPRVGREDISAVAHRGSHLHRFALGVVCAKVALVLLVFDPLSVSVFAQPKALLAVALDVALVALLAGVALERRDLLRWSPLHIPVVVFTVAYLVATPFALDQRIAVFGTPDRYLGLIAALDAVLVYVALTVLVRTREDVRWIGATLAGAAGLILGYEVLQWIGWDPVSWGRPPREALFSTLGNRGVLAQFLATASVAAAGVAFAPIDVGRRVRFAAAALSVAGLAGMLAAGARAALLGLIVGGATLAVVRILWEEDPRRRALSAIAAATLVAAALAVSILSPVGQRFEVLLRDPAALVTSGAGVADLSVAGRLDLYRAAVEIWRERPILGVGPDNYAVAYPKHRSPEASRLHDSNAPQSSTHGWVFKLATDAGALAPIALLAAALLSFFLTVRGERESWRLAACGGLAAFLSAGALSVDHVGISWLPWLGFGLIAARIRAPVAAHDGGPMGRRRGSQRRRSPDGLTRLVLAAALGGLVLGSLAIKGPLEAARLAQVARAAGAGHESLREVALRAAQRATALDADRADYWYELGRAYLRVSDERQAERSFSRAAELAPHQTPYLTTLARVQASRGLTGDRAEKQAALDTARRAASNDPNDPDAQVTLSIVAHVAGEPEECVAAGERAFSVGPQPSDANLYIAMGAAYQELGRSEDSERTVRLGLAMSGIPLPQLSALRLQLARTLVATGRPAEALSVLELLLSADPNYARALDLKDQIEER